MNNELELRILNVNKEDVIKRLEDLNATKINDYNYIRYVYDTKPKDENKWIRLRTDGYITTLTYKEYENSTIEGTKELEIIVSDIDKTKEILSVLGYQYRSVQENKRTRYMINDVEIDIDDWPYLNTYIEVEGQDDKKVFEVVEKLKDLGTEVTGKNIQTLYIEKGYKEEDLNNLKFKEEK